MAISMSMPFSRRILICFSVVLMVSCQTQSLKPMISTPPSSTPNAGLKSNQDLLTATLTPKPTIIVEPSITPTEIPTGNWFVLCRDKINEIEPGFIAFHTDTGATITSPIDDFSDCRHVYSTSQGDRLALLSSPNRTAGTNISFLSLPSLDFLSETQIFEEQTYAVDASLSPDGRYLAYSLYSEDPPGKIHLIDSLSGESQQIISSQAHIDSLTWSPNGEWIAFREVDEYDDFWAGAIGTAVKAVSPLTGDLRSLQSHGDFQIVIGSWTDNDELLTMELRLMSVPDLAGEHAEYSFRNLTAVSVEESDPRLVFSGGIDNFLVNPISREILIGAEATPDSENFSYYIASSDRSNPSLIYRSNGYGYISWLFEAEVYAIVDQSNFLFIDPDGQVVRQSYFSDIKEISPDGKLAVAYPYAPPEDPQNQVRIHQIDGNLLQTFETYTPYTLTWHPDSQGFMYSNGWGDIHYLNIAEGDPVYVSWVISESVRGGIPFYVWSSLTP